MRLQVYSYLPLTPFGAVVYIILAQAKNAIALRLKPIILTLIAFFDKRQGVPIGAVTFDNEAGITENEVTHKSPHRLLGFVSDTAISKPTFNNQFNPGSFFTAIFRSPRPMTLTGTKTRATSKGRFSFVSLPAPFTFKLCGWLAKGVMLTPNCAFPLVHAVIRTKAPLVIPSTRPYPKLLAAALTVAINSVLRGRGYAFARLCPAGTGTVLPAAVLSATRNNGEGSSTDSAYSVYPFFQRFPHAFLGAKGFVVMFLAACRALSHRIALNTIAPLGFGCCLGSAAERGEPRFYGIRAA